MTAVDKMTMENLSRISPSPSQRSIKKRVASKRIQNSSNYNAGNSGKRPGKNTSSSIDNKKKTMEKIADQDWNMRSLVGASYCNGNQNNLRKAYPDLQIYIMIGLRPRELL